MKKIGDAIGDLDRWIWPVSKFSLRNWSSSFCSIRANGQTLQLEAFSPAIRSTVWSHFLDSGRASKDSLEKTLSNSYLGGAEASELRLNASAKHWETLEVAAGTRPITKMRSPGSIGSSASLGSSSSDSVWSSGTGLSETALAFWAILSSWALSLHPEQQQGGHLDILTSPVTQSISGLCFHSQECPRMSFCFPKLVTANNVCSEWFQYLKMKSTTSVIEPASFRVPSKL